MSENLYKIKTEAVQYFSDEVAPRILSKDQWKEWYNIDESALEEVKMPYISYGIKTSSNATSLGGWSEKEGGRYEFTILFPSINFQDNDEFSSGKMTRSLMDKVQNIINQHFIEFHDKQSRKKQ